MQDIRPCIIDEYYIKIAISKSLLATRGYIYGVKYNLNEVQRYFISSVLHILTKFDNKSSLRKLFNISLIINKSCHLKVLTFKDPSNYEFNYKTIMQKILMNLDPECSINNTYLIKNIINNRIDIQNLCFYESNILFPSKNFEIYQKVKDRTNIVIEKKFTTLYTCGKCKEKKCTYQAVQLRSADEGCNLKIECTNCNHCWVI